MQLPLAPLVKSLQFRIIYAHCKRNYTGCIRPFCGISGVNLQKLSLLATPPHAFQPENPALYSCIRRLTVSPKCPPPPFFRNTALLVLVLTSAGCAALDNHCRSGFDGFTTRIQQGFPFLPFWLVLGIQSAILGLAVALLFSWLLYFIQLRQLKNWDISKSGNPPSPVSSWVIPTVFLFFLVFPFLLFLILVGDCESSYRWSHTLGACAGFLIGWGFVFVVYFLREIRKLRK